jgi:hypothetical protein
MDIQVNSCKKMKYPIFLGNYTTGFPIEGIQSKENYQEDSTVVFHAGTSIKVGLYTNSNQ